MRLTRFANSIVSCLMLALMLCPMSIRAQQAETIYVYDTNGRLAGVIAPDGDVAVYRYDSRGNLIEIKRVRTGATSKQKRKGQAQNQSGVVIITIVPNRARVGAEVTIRGAGFIPIPEGNMVAFNGVPTTVSAATETSLTVIVPEGAETGPVTVVNQRGLATSFDPFIVLGEIRITPPVLGVVLGRAAQFAAEVPGGQDQGVMWSVAGIEGGTELLGTISPEGVYRAPKDFPGLPSFPSREVKFVQLLVEAASLSDPDVFGEATVLLADSPTDFAQTAVSVQVGSPRGVADASPVTVQVGNPVGPFINSLPVSVQVGNPLGPFVVAPPVAVASGPVLSSIAPASAPRGSTDLTLTLTGQNLMGATAVEFFLLNGRTDPNITGTNLDVNADGTQLMVTIDISPSAEEGRRLVIVRTAEGRSQLTLSESNAFLVTQE